MPIKIGICDDQAEDMRELAAALLAYEPSFRIATYTSGESLLMDCCDDGSQFDLLVLDIYMPGLGGLEVAGKLRLCAPDTKIILFSSSEEHYPEAYDLFAFNYLVKPLNREKLHRVLAQALAEIDKQHEQQISISYKGTTYRLRARDILYLESSDKVIFFHFADRNRLQCYAKLDDILAQLPAETFIRCHQSYAVSVLHVNEMAESHFRVGQAAISISKRYLRSAREKYFAYLFAHLGDR